MWLNQSECLLKRELFAISLRKKKKTQLLQTKRLKLDNQHDLKGTLS
jgi:hypothetical protein